MMRFTAFVVIIGIVVADEPVNEEQISSSEESQNPYNMLSLIESFEEATGSHGLNEPMFSQENIKFTPKVTEILENIVDELKTPSNAYNFIQSKGIEKIVAPILLNNDPKHAEPVIIIIKKLFQLVPETVTTVIPNSLLEKVIELYEYNMNPKLTSHAVEIISLWLPKNPRAQTFVIKVRGLQQFYAQLSYLDADNVGKMLSLFTKLIKEHMEIRGKETELKEDKITQNMYVRVGLLEIVASHETCMYFINVYEDYLPEGDKLIVELIDLMMTTKQFCYNVYKEKSNVIYSFKNIMNYLSDNTKIGHFEAMRLNVVDAKKFLEDYITEISQKGEL